MATLEGTGKKSHYTYLVHLVTILTTPNWPNKKFYQILNGRNLLNDQMEFLNEVWDTLKEISESKMKKIFDRQRDNNGQLDYGGCETYVRSTRYKLYNELFRVILAGFWIFCIAIHNRRSPYQLLKQAKSETTIPNDNFLIQKTTKDGWIACWIWPIWIQRIALCYNAVIKSHTHKICNIWYTKSYRWVLI